MTDAPLPAFLSGYPTPFSDGDLETVDVLADAAPREIRDRVKWRPTDDAGADWAMRKLAETVHAGRPIAEQAQAWRERIDAWEERELATTTRRVEFFRSMLVEYGLRVRAESDGRRKTINLPAGSISTRGSTDERIEMIDAEAFMASLRTAPPLVRETLTRTEPKPISELRRLLVRYTRTACRSCGTITERNDGWVYCPECKAPDSEVVETFIGIPRFGLDPDNAVGCFRVDGVVMAAPPAPSASVALADERALPRP